MNEITEQQWRAEFKGKPPVQLSNVKTIFPGYHELEGHGKIFYGKLLNDDFFMAFTDDGRGMSWNALQPVPKSL